MAGSTLFVKGHPPIKTVLVTGPELIMGIMAPDTILVSLRIFDLLATMNFFIQFVHDRIVAGQAFLLFEEIGQVLVDILRIRVALLPHNLSMAIRTGDLTVG